MIDSNRQPHVDLHLEFSGSFPIHLPSPGRQEASMGIPRLRVVSDDPGPTVPAGTVHCIRDSTHPVTIGEVCQVVLDRMRGKVAGGELSSRTFEEYDTAADALLEAFGADRPIETLRPADFTALRASLADRLALSTLKKRIGMIRTVLGYAGDLRDEQDNPRFTGTIDYGREFERPAQKAIRREQAEKPVRLFTSGEILKLLEEAREPIRTMILLGINCGYGNTDVATLRWSAVDLADRGWIRYPRPKTGIERNSPLWPETREALSQLTPGTSDDLLFRTRGGNAWVRMTPSRRDPAKTTKQDDLAKAFRILADRCGIEREGVGFYSLRHTFATWGAEAKDPIAVNALMGHADGSIPGQYRHDVSQKQLIDVVTTVRKRLFGKH